MASNWTMPGEYEAPRHFGGGPKSPPPNPPPPSTSDADVQAASAQARAAARNRRGRQSTILAPDSGYASDATQPASTTGKARIGD